MTVNIEYESELDLSIDHEGIIRKVIDAAIEFEDCPYEVSVNVVIVSNEEIALINNDYRGINKPTDVLSFPMIEYVVPGDFSVIEDMAEEDCFDPDSGELILGDIIISADKVAEQSDSYGHSMERELGFLVAHSMLHLFGYDHMEDSQRALMEEKQRDILDMIGLTRDYTA